MASDPPRRSDGPITVIDWKKWESILRVIMYSFIILFMFYMLLFEGRLVIP